MNSQSFFLISQIGHEVTLWLLLFLSIITLAVALEKFFYLKSWQKSINVLRKEVQNINDKSSWIRAFQYTHLKPDLNLKVVSKFLKKEPHLAEDVMRSFVLSKKNELESKLNILSTVGSNAPFIGLLGTIFGVMEAFYSLGVSSESATPIVMQGISKALLATAIGLIVAIPAVVFYNFLRRKVHKIGDDFEYLQSIIKICSRSSTPEDFESDSFLEKESLKNDSDPKDKSSFGEKSFNEK